MGFKEDDNQAPADGAVEAADGGFAQGSDYKPAGAAKKGIPLLAVEHPDFRLLFHPLRWGYFLSADGSQVEWLPNLRRLALSPGTDNVDKDGDPSYAIGIAAQEGWQTIEPSAADPYIVQHDGKGGTVHLCRWQRVKVLGNTAFLSSDEAGYRAWLREVCRRRGWKPDADVIALKRAQLEAEVNRDSGFNDAASKARAAAGQKALDLIDGKKPKAAAKGAA